MKRRVPLLVLLVGIATMSSAFAEPPVVIKGDAFEEATITKVLKEFWNVCAPLAAHMQDVLEARVETGEEYAAHRLANGWTKTFHLAIPLTETPASLPKYDDEIGVIAGQTLHYDLGGGTRPGLFASKRVSQKLCDMPVSDRGADVFKDVAGFAFVRY